MDKTRKRTSSKIHEDYTDDDIVEKTSRLRKLQKFVWNPKTNEVLGRTALRWARISLYYSIFYSLLGTFFVIIFAIFLTTISRHLPTFYNKESVMDYKGVNPGMGFRPMVSATNNIIELGSREQNELMFKEYKTYVESFLEQNKSTTNLINCTIAPNQSLEIGKVCEYSYSDIIKPGNPCHFNNFAGYYNHTPCVIIKLNRIIGWVPTQGNSTLDPSLDPNYIYFKCSGMNPLDEEYFPEVEYYSMGTPEGNSRYGSLPYSYFPYFNYYDYIPPFIAVHFKSIPKNHTLNVLCRAYAPNIDNENVNDYRGMTYFRLAVRDNINS